MPRTARKISKTGIYHLVLRGINRQTIFEEDEDAIKFLDTLQRYQKECDFEIYAYCLMGNHIHLLVKEGKEKIGQTMKRIGVSYVYWYNYKYDRSGHLFQGRYKSEVVEDDSYLLVVLRYIHQNPLKAKMVKDIEDYQWSSYHEYIGNNSKMVNCDFILGIFSNDRVKALTLFREFHERENQDQCLDVDNRRIIKDDEAIKIIREIFNVASIKDISGIDAVYRDNRLKILKEMGLSTRQIARLTGVPRYIVLKV